jgi:hypothetical protein
LPALDKLVGLVLLLASVLFGFASASKTSVLFPLVAAVAGLLLGGRKVICAVLTAIIVLLYPSLANVVDAQRSHWQHDTLANSVAQRFEILVEVLRDDELGRTATKADEKDNPLIRFSHGPYQAFLIKEWYEGRPGNSLADVWTALIPRILWPDKPIITRFGGELYGTIFNVDRATSNQAPTYTGEAFWNYGWVGLIVVSILLGLQIGWFSLKWLELSFGKTTAIGILVFSLPVVLNSWAVETWIAASYVGGFVTLVVLIKAADWAASFLIAPARRPHFGVTPG